MGSQSAQNHHGVTELSWAQPEGDSEGESDPHLWAAHGRSCWELRAQHATAERGRQAWSSTAQPRHCRNTAQTEVVGGGRPSHSVGLAEQKAPCRTWQSNGAVTFESTKVGICFASKRISKDVRRRPALPALQLLGREERSAIFC